VLGIPTVVQVKGATTEIRAGSRLRVDGAAGTVTVLAAPPDDAATADNAATAGAEATTGAGATAVAGAPVTGEAEPPEGALAAHDATPTAEDTARTETHP
jgi:pyruvate,water dikinase